MSAVWSVARQQLRGSLRSTILLALVAGLAAAIAMSVWAAGRRSSGAVDRFIAQADVADVAVNVCPPGFDLEAEGDPSPCYTYAAEDEQRALRALGHVEQVGLFHWRTVVGGLSGDSESWIPFSVVDVGEGITSSTAFGEPLLVAGRLPEVDAPDEVAVREGIAESAGVDVGDEVFLRAVGSGGSVEPFTSTVVGVVRTPLDLAPVGPASFTGPALFARAGWVRAHGEDAPGFGVLLAWLDDDGTDAFLAEASRVLDGRVLQSSPVLDAGELATVEQAVDFEGRAAVVTAAVAGLGALLLVAQAVSRQARAEMGMAPTLRALGVSRGQLATVAVLRWLPVAVGAAVVAVVGTLVASLHGPVGVARRGPWERSISADGVVLTVGMVVVGITVLLIAVRRAFRPGPTGRRAWGPGLPVPVQSPGLSVGLGLAWHSLGRTALPLTSAILATGLAIAAVVTTAGGAASLQAVVDDPARFGAPWDVLIEFPPTAAGPEGEEEVLAGLPGVTDGAQILGRDANIGDAHGVWVQALAPVEGVELSEPVIVDGRAPAEEDEIALGRLTRDRAGVEVGDSVVVTSPTTGASASFDVVGLTMVTDGYEPNVGHGAFVTPAGLRRFDPAVTEFPSVALRLEDGPAGDEALATLARAFPGVRQPFPVPASLANANRVRDLPVALALAGALVAALTFTHALVTTILRERRSLAVCRVMGFTRRQVAGAVATSATLLGLAAAAVGVVVGIAGARWGWRTFARSFGVVSGPVLAPWVLVAGVMAALVIANLAAAVPARTAARRRPAEALRVE